MSQDGSFKQMSSDCNAVQKNFILKENKIMDPVVQRRIKLNLTTLVFDW
jgi:hypothetical protein